MKWEVISRPKVCGGWAFKNLHHFGLALASKRLWRIFNGTSLWRNIIMDKYLKYKYLANWLWSSR